MVCDPDHFKCFPLWTIMKHKTLTSGQQIRIINRFFSKYWTITEIAENIVANNKIKIYNLGNAKRIVCDIVNKHLEKTEVGFKFMEATKSKDIKHWMFKTYDNEVSEEVLFGVPLPEQYKLKYV